MQGPEVIIVEWEMEDQLKKAGVFALAFAVVWLIAAAMLPSLVPQFNIVSWLLGAILVLIIPAMFVASQSSLEQDVAHRRGGGHMRGDVEIWHVVVIFVAVALLAFAAYSVGAQKQSATPQAPVQPAPLPGSSTDTSTTQVRGLGASLQEVQYPATSLADQTYSTDAVDYVQGTAVTAIVVVNSTDTVSGKPYQQTTLAPGKTMSVLVSKSAYLSDVVTVRAGQKDVPVAHAKLKSYDTAVTLAAYNTGVNNPPNAITTPTDRALMTASSPYTFTISMTPSAQNKLIGGGSDAGSFVLMWNVSTTNQWAPSNFGASLSSAFTGSRNCAPITLATSPTALTGYVGAVRCFGDFDGTNLNAYALSYTVYPNAAWSAGNQTAQLCFAGDDYYQQVKVEKDPATGAILKQVGSYQVGPVKDNGAAIQTLQCVSIYLR